MKEFKKDFSKLGFAYLIGTLIIYGAQLLTMMIVQNVKPEWLADANISIMLSVLPMYLVGMPVLVWLVKRIPAQVPEKHPIKKGAFVLAVIMSFGLTYVSNIVGTMITLVIGMIKGEMVQNVVAQMTADTSLWVIILYMVICAPILEECIFRKLIVDRMVKYGQGVAVVMSGLMFGLFHGNLNQFVYAFTLGMFFAYIYVKTGNIKITIALHMLINFTGGFLSTVLTRSLDMDEYMTVFNSGDVNVMMEYIMNNLGAIIGLLAFAFFVFGTVIAGTILFIVAFVKKKFVLEKGEVELPKGQKFSTMFLNVGMILFGIFWVVMIILQLFE